MTIDEAIEVLEYVLGADKKETKQLKTRIVNRVQIRKIFEERNKTYPYPKERGK